MRFQTLTTGLASLALLGIASLAHADGKVIGAERHQGGRLVVSLEPRW